MERRDKERYEIWFPMTVVTDDGQTGTAITYDVSVSGLLMACPGRLTVGDHVTLRFKIDETSEEREIGATIRRVDENAGDESPWRFRMAVEFDDEHDDLEALLREHSETP